jgi:ATP-binding cassette subfamily C protein LapB
MTQPTPQDPAAAAKANTVRLREDLIHPDPLLDCLVELCRLHGQAATRASLSAALPLRDGRLTIELAERAAARAGMTTRLQRLALDALDTAALPAVLVLKDNRACVLLGFDADSGQARVLLPETGQGSVNLLRDDLAERYTGVVLFARPHFRFDSRTERAEAKARPLASGHWFWGALLEQRIVYRDVLWAALLINLFALVSRCSR